MANWNLKLAVCSKSTCGYTYICMWSGYVTLYLYYVHLQFVIVGFRDYFIYVLPLSVGMLENKRRKLLLRFYSVQFVNLKCIAHIKPTYCVYNIDSV